MTTEGTPAAGESGAPGRVSGRLPDRLRPVDYLPIVVAMLVWAWPMIFIRYIRARTNSEFGEDGLNFYRYASAAILTLGTAALRRPADLLAVLRRPLVPLALAALLVFFQSVWVRGVCLVPASYGTLIGRSTLVFSLLLTFALFPDERRVMRSRSFLLAALAALAAVAGVIALSPGFRTGGDMAAGTALLLVSSVIWALYSATVRRLVRGLPAMATFAVTVAVTTLLLLPAALREARMGVMWSSPFDVQLAVVFSGAACVGVTQMLYYVSLKRIGVARSSLAGLSLPFLTGVFAWMVAGESEKLTAGQWACGAALVAALAYMILRSSGRAEAVGPGGTPGGDGQ